MVGRGGPRRKTTTRKRGLLPSSAGGVYKNALAAALQYCIVYRYYNSLTRSSGGCCTTTAEVGSLLSYRSRVLNLFTLLYFTLRTYQESIKIPVYCQTVVYPLVDPLGSARASFARAVRRSRSAAVCGYPGAHHLPRLIPLLAVSLPSILAFSCTVLCDDLFVSERGRLSLCCALCCGG